MATTKAPTEFTLNVIKMIKAIPRGRVATYGQIATLAGKPGAARAVNWILSSCGRKYELPWQRVIGAGGHVKFPPGSAKYRLQARLLKVEGVASARGEVDLSQYGWAKKVAMPAGPPRPKMFG